MRTDPIQESLLGKFAYDASQDFNNSVVLSEGCIIFWRWGHVYDQQSHRVDSDEDLDDVFGVVQKVVHGSINSISSLPILFRSYRGCAFRLLISLELWIRRAAVLNI